jgi:hypothetical protein
MADDRSQLPDVGDDGAVADSGGDEASDVASDTGVNGDVTSENIATGADARDVTSENVVIGVDASDVSSEDVAVGLDASDVTIRDVAIEEAAPMDGCVRTGPENCTNGIDDDCNGLIDCADPACAAYTCVPPVPVGWVGPVALWQAANPATPPACQANYGAPLDQTSGLNAPPATCGACTCGASGQTCSATGTFHLDQTCVSASCATVTPAPAGTCTAVPANTCGSGGSFTMGAAVPTPTGGSCAIASAGTVNRPLVTWTTSARVCSYTGTPDSPGGCTTGGQQCVAAPTGNYGTTLCVYSTMAPPPSSCPAGFAAIGPAVFYSGQTDTRDCAGCTCASSPTGGTCSGSVSLYGNNAGGCNGTPATYALGTTCQCYGCAQPALPNVPGFVQANYTVTAGTCSVVGQPAPTGSVTPTGPTTLCCM